MSEERIMFVNDVEVRFFANGAMEITRHERERSTQVALEPEEARAVLARYLKLNYRAKQSGVRSDQR